ncbi:MAG: HEAT repeat domain-containing protein [Bryobacteraceae bacterium]
MDSEVRALVERFESNPFHARRQLRELLDADPRVFRIAALPLLKEAEAAAAGSGRRFLVTFLAQNGLLMDALASADGLGLSEAISVAKTAMKVEPALLNRLATWIERPDLTTPVRERLLEIIAGVADPGRLMPILFQVSRGAEPRIRSKVALLIGKSNKNAEWLRDRLNEHDPRVRANAVEALWGLEFETCLAVFRQAAADAAPRVAGNAAYGLYLAKDTSSIRILLDMAARPEPSWKATAAWAMGRTQDPRFLSVLEPMLRDEAAGVRQNSLKARVKIQQRANRLRESSPIAVHPTLLDASPDGQRNLSLLVRNKEGCDFDPALLDPVSVIVREDGNLIGEFELERLARSSSMWVGFAVTDEWHRPCQNGLKALLPEKDPGDALALMRFADTDPGSQSSKVPVAGAADPGGSEARPGAASFQCEPDKAAQAFDIAAQGNVPGMLEAMRALIQAMATASSKRRLAVVAHRDIPEEHAAAIETVIAMARTASVQICAMAPASTSGLRALCQRTGGTFFECASAEQARGRLAQLMRYLHHQFEVRYSGGPVPKQVSVQVCSEHGVGEGSLTI